MSLTSSPATPVPTGFEVRVGLSERLGVLSLGAMAMLAFVAATNHWASWSDAVSRYHDGDPISYRAIAAAAPGLLHRRIAEWHAERFIPNYLVGCVAKLLHTGLSSTYRFACILLAVAICLALAELLSRLPVSRFGALVCLGVFILNPYGLRYFLFGVGRVADLAFILGALLAVRGLALRTPVSLLVGLLVAVAARQTALPAAFAAGAVIITDRCWRSHLGRLRGAFVLFVVVVPVAAYVVIRIIAASFAGPSPSLHAMTLLGADDLHSLVEHLARSAIALLPVTALLAASWWVSRGRRVLAADRAACYGCLLFGASIAIQPFLLNPPFATDSEPRLAVLGLAPLVVALALFLAGLQFSHAVKLGAGVTAALLGLLAIGSLHHIFTLVGPASKTQTVVVQCVVAATAGAILLWIDRRNRVGEADKLR